VVSLNDYLAAARILMSSHTGDSKVFEEGIVHGRHADSMATALEANRKQGGRRNPVHGGYQRNNERTRIKAG
jgi:hypothetical protein